jgi:hypothetical protein
VWTVDYERGVYKQIDDAVRPGLRDDYVRRHLVSYIIKRLKTELPDGLESVSADSIKALSVKISKEYTNGENIDHDDELTPTAVPWTAETERNLRDVFLKGSKKEDLLTENKLCDCVIIKLKKIYPDSVVVPFPQNIILRVSKECGDEMAGYDVK